MKGDVAVTLLHQHLDGQSRAGCVVNDDGVPGASRD